MAPIKKATDIQTPSDFSEIIQEISVRFPTLTISGIGGAGAEFEMGRAELTSTAHFKAFRACLAFLEMIASLWKTAARACDVLARVEKSSGMKNKIPAGILFAAAVYFGCKIEIREPDEDYFGPYRTPYFIKPPERSL